MSLDMIFSKRWKGIFSEYFGHFKLLSMLEKELPPLGNNDVLIKVRACGISNSKLHSHLPFLKRNVLGIGMDVAGTVLAIGSDVTSLAAGDDVVGIVPMDSRQSGCCNFIVMQEHDVVIKPSKVSFVHAAGCIGDALKVYVALNYLAKVKPGDTVFVFDGASSFGSLCIQYARLWGARVLTTSSSEDETCYLASLSLGPHDVYDLTDESFNLVQSIWAETCNLGVNVIVDCSSPVQNVVDRPSNSIPQRHYASNSKRSKLMAACDKISHESSREDVDRLLHEVWMKEFPMVESMYKPKQAEQAEDNAQNVIPQRTFSTHDVISSLAVCGKWVTTKSDLQLDPPSSLSLYLRCGSVCYLFEHAIRFACTSQGKYQHILKDVMDNIASKTIVPNIHHTITFDSGVEAVVAATESRIGKVVMTM